MNLWDHYQGKIVYLVLEEKEVIRLVKQSREELIAFSFGDSVNSYIDLVYPVVCPNSIEALSLMLNVLIKNGLSKNILVDDAYIMQSLSRTAMGKGAAIKGFLSTFTHKIEKTGRTLIFVSEAEDFILRRNFAKFDQMNLD